MTEPLAAHVSVFHDSTTTVPVDAFPLTTVLQHIQDGRYRRYVEQLRRTRATTGKDAYARAKRHSVAFTPAGTFTARNNASLQTPSGCLNYDMDDIADLDHARALLGADPHLIYMFVSPSGVGLKLGMHVNAYANATTYRHAWLAVERYLVATYPDLAVNNDGQCKDVARLCYVSWDPDLHKNPEAVPFVVPPPPPPAPQPTQRPRMTPLPPDRRHRYAQQAIETAIKLLDASVDGIRDQQRLKASRLLGGYIAGGVLSEAEAKAGIAAALERNTSDSARAWRVIARGLGYGETAPISLDDLDAEYERWRATHPAPRPATTPAAQEADAPPALVHHKLPDYIRDHPDPRVRKHWERVYRKTALLKERYAREGGLLCPR